MAIALKSSVLRSTPLCYTLYIHWKKIKMVLALMRLQPKSNIKEKIKVRYSSGEDNERLLLTVRGSNLSI